MDWGLGASQSQGKVPGVFRIEDNDDQDTEWFNQGISTSVFYSKLEN